MQEKFCCAHAALLFHVTVSSTYLVQHRPRGSQGILIWILDSELTDILAN